jgi:hypothetical protein
MKLLIVKNLVRFHLALVWRQRLITSEALAKMNNVAKMVAKSTYLIYILSILYTSNVTFYLKFGKHNLTWLFDKKSFVRLYDKSHPGNQLLINGEENAESLYTS